MAPKKRKLEQQEAKSQLQVEVVTPTSAPAANGADEVVDNSNAASVSSIPEDPASQGEPVVLYDVPNPEEAPTAEDVPTKEEIPEGSQESLLEESSAPAPVTDNPAETVLGGTGDDDGPEPIQTLLEPLSKEQLVAILTEAAEKHVDVMQAVQLVADSDPTHRKIFVHGLGWDTDTECLTSVFKQYGEIEDCKTVRDKSSGKSKGYAFILFKHRSGARKALKEPQKKIGNRMTACQLACIGPVPQQPQQPSQPIPAVSEYTQRKIFVSNVSADIDPRKLLQFFSKYGEIEEGPLGLDKQTGKPKGFTLFVYKSVESAKKALEEPHKVFEGHTLHCQKAIDGPKTNKPSWNQWSQPSPAAARPGLSSSYASGMGSHIPPSGPGHLMAPSTPGGSTISPAIGQALTTLLSNPAAGLGLTNLLGSLASPGISGHNQTAPSMLNGGGYGNRPAGIGSYGGQNVVPSGYGNVPGQVSGWGYRPGYKGGVPPHMGR